MNDWKFGNWKLAIELRLYNASSLGGTMLSRRRVLKLGTAAAGAALASPVTAATSENSPALPPSIARLKSMIDQAKPISTEERGERQEKARRLMAENKLDAILLTEGTSLTYFSAASIGAVASGCLQWCCR
jgi:hypothetical protein